MSCYCGILSNSVFDGIIIISNILYFFKTTDSSGNVDIAFFIMEVTAFINYIFILFSAYKIMKLERAWGGYKEIIKDNPYDYEHAFAQMVYALSYLNGEIDVFEKDTYATDKIRTHLEIIRGIISKRQVDASDDWKTLGESLSVEEIPDFDMDEYIEQYMASQDKSDTSLGRFLPGHFYKKRW